jgi:hypothetical protein
MAAPVLEPVEDGKIALQSVDGQCYESIPWSP